MRTRLPGLASDGSGGSVGVYVPVLVATAYLQQQKSGIGRKRFRAYRPNLPTDVR
jgi:hypothetical protein